LQCRWGSRWSEGRKLRRGEVSAADEDDGNTTAGADEEEEEVVEDEKEAGWRWELCTPCVVNLRKGFTSGMRNFMMCAMSSVGSCSILVEWDRLRTPRFPSLLCLLNPITRSSARTFRVVGLVVVYDVNCRYREVTPSATLNYIKCEKKKEQKKE
jgi:hypothetical protein